MLKLYEAVLSWQYDAACWEQLNTMPDHMWADYSNMYDGCAFE